MNKNILSSVGIVLGITLGLLGLMRTPHVDVAELAQALKQPVVGSVASPILNSAYFGFGGNILWGAHTDSLVAATTTSCVLISPAATSTLVSASFIISSSTATGGTLSSGTIYMAKATNPYSTTTLVGQRAFTVPMNTPIIASTTFATNDTAIFGPSNYLTVSLNGAVGYTPTGSCSAIWEQIAY